MLHPLIRVVEKSAIEGRGLVASGLIRAGEVIQHTDLQQPQTLISEALTWPQAQQDELLVHSLQISATHYLTETGDERFMNHSCDPNTWWRDDLTMVARRDIQAGEEVTYDYSTTELAIAFAMTCHCGAARCRRVITHQDYLRPEWQAHFGEHLPSHTRAAIALALRQGHAG